MFNYRLGIRSTYSTEQVRTKLLTILGVQNLTEVPQRWPALEISVRYETEITYPPGREMYIEELGAMATTQVYYSVDNKIKDDDEFIRAEAVMFVSVAELVERVDATAVFSFESGLVIMRRVNAVMHLSERWPWEVPDVLARLQVTPVYHKELESMVAIPPPPG